MDADRPGVPAPPPLFVFGPLLLLLALELWRPTHLFPAPSRWVAGATLVVAGVAFAGWAGRTQARAGTHVDPYKPTTRIVTSGPYRISRNPIYLGFLPMAAGVAILLDSAWALLALPIGLLLLDRFVIVREERYLDAKFGAEYAAYKRRVRRWL